MLEALRKAAGTWVAKGLLLLLVVSFAIWGVSGQLHGNMGGSVVTVGDTEVSVADYRLAYDRQLSVLSQRYGQRITREQAQAMGLDGQVLAQLAAGATLDEQARKLGLGVSKDRLASLTADDPAFQGTDGKFDRRTFEYVLRQVGMSPDEYFLNRQQVAVRQQIVEAVADGIKAPDAFLRAVSLYQGEDRTAEYLVLQRSLVEPIDAPDAAATEKWFEEHKATYAAPEYRKIAYVKLEPADIADPSSVGDEQVAEEYEKNKVRYTTPETRTIEQVVFPTVEAAQAARNSLLGGATFEEIVAGAGKTMTDVQLGTFQKKDVADAAVAEAAFALASQAVSDVVQGAFGPVLLRVTDIKPETAQPLAEVKDEIRNKLAMVEAGRVLMDVHDSYEDARAGGESMREAAERLKLKVVTIDAVDRAGQQPDGTVVTGLPQSADLIRGAFESDVGVENPALTVGSSGYLFYEVESVTPARDRTLDEVRDRVVADWTDNEASSRLAAKAGELEKRLKDGTATLDQMATELSLDKQVKRGLKRGADDGDFGPGGVQAVFGVAENGSGLAASPDNGAQILFKVTEVFEPAGAGPDAISEDQRKAFSQGLADDLLDEMVARLQTDFGVEVNQGVASRALSF
ncbi:MAG: SurA N-terminal domain-containing protein [Rhizobiaceae bacterium]|nr:SurA N-terminal domain-containing protein [Rhizobiaceae bacterium]